jgi:addiction module HigA family antidote
MSGILKPPSGSGPRSNRRSSVFINFLKSVRSRWTSCLAGDTGTSRGNGTALSTESNLKWALGVSRQTINEVLRERRAVSPEMALRLSRLFGNSPEFWLNAQRAVDLWEAARAIKTKVERIKPLSAA